MTSRYEGSKGNTGPGAVAGKSYFWSCFPVLSEVEGSSYLRKEPGKGEIGQGN